MRLKSIITLCSCLLLMSCDHPDSADTSLPQDTSDATTRDVISSVATGSGTAPDTIRMCFRFDEQEQHNWMNLTRVGDTAYGDLHYTWEEKDGAEGPFHGKFRGDTLWIVFNSMMEGNAVDIDRVYLVSGTKLLEGQGMQKSNDEGTRYTFKHPGRIEFPGADFLSQGECQ